MNKAILIGTVALSMAAAPAFAQKKQTKAASAPAAAKQRSDQKFVTDAAKGGMAEVELGKLAQDKASSDQVKNFGKRMVDDHSKANDELQTLAKNKNITLPTDLDPKDKALKDRLSKLSTPRMKNPNTKRMTAYCTACPRIRLLPLFRP